MDAVKQTELFNAMFIQLQQSVDYKTDNRDSVMCGKYSMYIGMLEGLIKIHVPKNKQKQFMEEMQTTVNKLCKI